jgi:hypothetical protein
MVGYCLRPKMPSACNRCAWQVRVPRGALLRSDCLPRLISPAVTKMKVKSFTYERNWTGTYYRQKLLPSCARHTTEDFADSEGNRTRAFGSRPYPRSLECQREAFVRRPTMSPTRRTTPPQYACACTRVKVLSPAPRRTLCDLDPRALA